MPRPAPSPRSAVRGFFLLTPTQTTDTTARLYKLFPLSCLIILTTTQTTHTTQGCTSCSRCRSYYFDDNKDNQRTTKTTKPVVFLSSQDKLLVFFHYLCPCQRPLLVNEGLHPPHVDDENENPRAWFFRPELESECAVTACLLMRKTNSQDWSCRLLLVPSSLLHRPVPLFTNAPR